MPKLRDEKPGIKGGRLLLFLCLLALLAPLHAQAKSGLYTIQIKSFPVTDKDKVLPIYDALTARGYLVYAYRKQIDKKVWVRIHVGLFDKAGQARAFGEHFSKTEGYEFFVTRAVARTTDLPGGGRVATTPSALWKQEADTNRELFRFAATDAAGRNIHKGIPATLTFSGNRDRAVFLYDGSLYAIDLGTGKWSVLADSTLRLGGLCRSTPRWSPGDEWIAFYDCYEWEVPTGLWLVGADGAGPYPLTDMSENQRAVKDAAWHPAGDGLYFIRGEAYGTVSVGGILYYTDLRGNHSTLVTPGERQEIAGPLSISYNRLRYNLVTFDKNYEHAERTAKSIPLTRPKTRQE